MCNTQGKSTTQDAMVRPHLSGKIGLLDPFLSGLLPYLLWLPMQVICVSLGLLTNAIDCLSIALTNAIIMVWVLH